MADSTLSDRVLELIRCSSTRLPPDVRGALERAVGHEAPRSVARSTLKKILENCRQADKQSTPICQDTGTLIFEARYGPGYRQSQLRADIEAACRQATERAYLRPNAVDPIAGNNSGDNVGVGAPYIHFVESERPGLEIRLLQKGGGCENVSAQYSLPHSGLKAGRDLEGVRRVVLDAIHQAQGRGCAPGIAGVGIGGDRGTSMLTGKAQLFRALDDENEDATLNELEKRLTRECNQLGVGPMGFGGATTVLAVKIGAMARHPASFFVSIAYMCWASRRASLFIDQNGEVSYAQ